MAAVRKSSFTGPPAASAAEAPSGTISVLHPGTVALCGHTVGLRADDCRRFDGLRTVWSKRPRWQEAQTLQGGDGVGRLHRQTGREGERRLDQLRVESKVAA